MKLNSSSPFSLPRVARRDFRPSAPLFVRPSVNRALARARSESTPSVGDFWTPDLVARLHAPFRSYRD